MFHIVSATRKNIDEFWLNSALGQSLRRFYQRFPFKAHIAYNNSLGLPKVYNQIVQNLECNDDLIVFVHDDIWIDDLFFFENLKESLSIFDVVGVVGCQIRVPFQVNWAFASRDIHTRQSEWISLNILSGSIAHGQHPTGEVSYYGPSKKGCKLLDGCFLASKVATLQGKSVFFDEQFNFHCYDTDFCRTAEIAGLKMGTWPLSLTHQSTGKVKYDVWDKEFERYRVKWSE